MGVALLVAVLAGDVATKLGGSAAISPVVKGIELVTFLTALVTAVAAIAQTVPPGTPTTAPAVSAVMASLSTILSTKVFTV